MPRRLLPWFLSLACAAPALGQGAPTAGGYCYSDALGPVVYFSAVFDTKLNPSVANAAFPIQREFYAHLKARYGFTTNSNYPVSCGFPNSVAVAEAERAVTEGRMRQERRQVVEVDWTYLPDEAAAAVSFNRTDSDPKKPPPPLPADHGFCVAGAFEGPLYVSDTFDAVAPVSIGQWGVVWLRFLGGKYGFKGPIQCENATLDGARRILKAWSDGARAASRNVVATGWKYDAAANSAPAPRVDEDREPPRPAAAPTATTDARKLAGKEAPAALAYCQKDRLLAVVFDCLRVQHAMIAYRIAHTAGTPELLASLFTGDKLDCTKCLDNYKQAAWAKRQALAQRMKAPAATCVSREFVAKLKAKPFPNRVQEHFDAAVAACK